VKKIIVLTNSQRTAIERSIAHWKRDIQYRFERGDRIRKLDYFLHSIPTGDLFWLSGGFTLDKVLCRSEDCPLCMLYLDYYGESVCIECPYRIFYGVPCFEKHWGKFIDNPNLKTCKALIKSLENILKANEEYNTNRS